MLGLSRDSADATMVPGAPLVPGAFAACKIQPVALPVGSNWCDLGVNDLSDI